MKLSVLVASLQHIMDGYGDIEAQLQDSGYRSPREDKAMDTTSGPGNVVSYPSFFVVPEEYELIDEQGEVSAKETVCNLRWWPY